MALTMVSHERSWVAASMLETGVVAGAITNNAAQEQMVRSRESLIDSRDASYASDTATVHSHPDAMQQEEGTAARTKPIGHADRTKGMGRRAAGRFATSRHGRRSKKVHNSSPGYFHPPPVSSSSTAEGAGEGGARCRAGRRAVQRGVVANSS